MEALDNAVMDHLRPFFYLVGLLVVSQFGLIVKYYLSKTEKKENKLLANIEHMNESINELSRHVLKIETKFDLFVEHYDKDLNNLGDKIRSLSN